MWIPKWYFEAQARKINELEHRLKQLELICLKDAKNKIASLQDKETDILTKDEGLTIEEIINQKINA